MATHKRVNLVAIVAMLLAVVLTVFCVAGTATGLIVTAHAMGYEQRLFDTERVHTIDIEMDDWEAFLTTCQNEEYTPCTVVIDGEKYANVGIRGKGNTSLSNVASMDSDRYSFKLEFDQYESGKSYHGLDKLCLNNIIQDNTYMKDYLAYRMMAAFGVDTPLCSFVYITVGGEDWGLYLAVEGVEESFLQRNYGSDYGELYKPDSMSFGGGRGNGKDFKMEDFDFGDETVDLTDIGLTEEDLEILGLTDADLSAVSLSELDMQALAKLDTSHLDISRLDLSDFGGFTMPQESGGRDGSSSGQREDMTPPDSDDMPSMPDGFDTAAMPDMSAMFGGVASETDMASGTDFSPGKMPDMGGAGGSGMGSSDVKLQYIDDDPDSYGNIFDNAKTDVTDSDEERLIASLKSLSSYENIENVVSVEEVLRYFVVHNYLVNGDSYTGSMIHNYYLYEQDGQLSMIPWDYNLAFGTFQGNNASDAVNDPIDEVLSDRPMQAWIFSDEAYSQQYHALYQEFLQTVDVQSIIDEAYTLIAAYVEKDPTAFCTYEEFTSGVEALRSFCRLRSESVLGQLTGSIPSTEEAQQADSSALVDTADLNLSDMGTMSTGGNHGDSRGAGDTDKQMPSEGSAGEAPEKPDSEDTDMTQMPGGQEPPTMPGGMGDSSFSPPQGDMAGGKMSTDSKPD